MKRNNLREVNDMKYHQRIQILRKAKEGGSLFAGFAGIVEAIVEMADEYDDPNTYIAEEVKMTLRAYKELLDGGCYEGI